MPKAKLVTRASSTSTVTEDTLNKASALTHAEMDSNLINLRDASFGIADDSSTVLQVTADKTITIAGSGTASTALSGDTLTITGSGISATSTDTLQNKTIDTANNTITIAEADISDLGSYITASSTDTLTNKTFDVEGTGNSIANIDVADLKSGVLDTDLASVSASDDTLASAKAIKSALDGKIADVVSDTTPQLGGNLDVNGNSIVSVSNGDIVIAPDGTGEIDLDGEVRFNKSYKEDINSLTSSSTITVDCSLAPIHTVTLATNTGFVISNLPTGGTVSIVITQDGTGSRTATFGTDGSTAVKFPGGAPTLTTTASGIDVVTIVNDGTNYLGNIAQAFA